MSQTDQFQLFADWFAEARESEIPIIYGDDIADPVLEAAGVREARLAILAMKDAVGARLVI